MGTTRRSEPTVAQAFIQIVASARTTSRRIEHTTLRINGLLRDFETFREPSGALARAAERKQEQQDGEYHGRVADGGPRPRTGDDPAKQSSDHRRPRFQSSMRA